MKNHDIIRYEVSGSTWCRHGLAVVYLEEGLVRAKDTYWGVGDTGVHGWLRTEDIQTGVVIGNIDEFENNPYKEFDDYADEDKFYVPLGGCSAQYWFRKGAEPEPELIYARLCSEVEEAKSKVRAANWKLEYKERLLSEHVNLHGVPVRKKDKETA